MATSTTGLGGDNTLTGTDGSDKIVAGGSDDTIDGGSGSDFLNAGGGNDTIIYDENDYKILGGGGIDTLWFKSGEQQLDLRTSAVYGIEKLWLDGGGWNQVWLSAADVVRVSDSDQMIVTGGGNNVLWLTDIGWKFDGLTPDGQSQILGNGNAKLIVSLPIYVDGFSNNASITVAGATTLTEDSVQPAQMLTATGTLTVTDPNAGQGLLLEGDITYDFSVGTLHITPDQPWSTSGPAVYAYTYSISNAAVQHLGEGLSLIEPFLIRTIDGFSTFLSFTITGVNDPATIGDPDQASVSEDTGVGLDGKLTATGMLAVSDRDSDEGYFITHVIPADGNLGSLVLAADGSYTFAVSNAAIQYLNTGDSKIETFTVQSGDGTRKDVSFTITGADDGATIGDPSNNVLTEDKNVGPTGLLTAAGAIAISSPNADQAFFETTVESADDNLGSLTLDADGSYVYAVSNASVQYLEDFEKKYDDFTVTALDGKTKTVRFEIHGVNDLRFDASPSSRIIDEFSDGSIFESENFAHTVGATVTGSHIGALSWTADPANQPYLGDFQAVLVGTTSVEWQFDVADKYLDYLLDGETLVQRFTVTVTGENSTIQKTIDIELHGTGDTPLSFDPALDGSGNMAGDLDGLVMRGFGGNDGLSYSGSGGRIYGDDGSDLILLSGADTIVRGGNGNDVLDIQSGTGTGNEIYGDNGNDEFNFRLLNAQDIWGGPGTDTYVVHVSDNSGAVPLIHDFDTRAPGEGGDLIDLSAILTDSQAGLDLSQSASNPTIFILSAENQLLSFVGLDLTLADFADNII